MKLLTTEDKDISKIDLTTCPSCGKSIPMAKSCNKCGANVGPEGRMSLKKANRYILLMGLVGCILLGYGYYQGNYITPIADITADMEGQIVRVQGIVTDVSYDYQYEKTAFTVNDSTGSIEFFGWSDFTSALRAASYYPSIGDEIIVEGKVNVYNSSYSGLILSLEVNDMNALTMIYHEALPKDIGSILLNDVFSKVLIQGNVTDRFLSESEGKIEFMSLDITDLTGTIEVYVNNAQIALADTLAIIPEVNQTVQIIGMVTEYGGSLEIIPSNATSSAITILEVP